MDYRPVSDLRPPSAYVHGPCVVVPARVAAWLAHRVRLTELRGTVRGRDPEVDNVLVALGVVALDWRTSVEAGRDAAPRAEVAPASAPARLTSSQAADLLGITGRAVRQAAQARRIPAEKVGGDWSFDRADVEHWRAARAARRAS